MTLPNDPDRSIQAEFVATFVDELVRGGVRDAVVSPGSRSCLLALALLSDGRITVHVRLDERSGGFFAIGVALSSGRPVVIVTTSGTAAVEVHAAVVEADLADVPLIVCSADRPIELHSVGAPQTVDQAGLYGRAVRYFTDLPVAEEATRPHWRSFTSRLVAEATTGAQGPGPVHANIAFREPMVGPVGTLPAGRADGAPWHRTVRGPMAAAGDLAVFVDALRDATRGVFIVGGSRLSESEPIVALASQCGWPILGDSRALARRPEPHLIAHADQFLRFDDVVERFIPDLVVHIGSPHASKTLMSWNEHIASRGVPHLLIDPYGSFEDPERYGALVIAADPAELCRQAGNVMQGTDRSTSWIADWRSCDDAAAGAIAQLLDDEETWTEPGIARAVFSQLEDGATLVCSSSMPVRDVEWFAPARIDAPRVLANRGANGIDGITSTVLGAAVGAEGRTIGITGDLAFLHDLSGLVWGSDEKIPQATMVVIDNSGGGIFSFLAFSAEVPPALFERGFSTPQRQQIAGVARGLGCVVREPGRLAELRTALDDLANVPGISVIVCTTDRDRNVAIHSEVSEAVHAAVADSLGNRAHR